MVWIPLVTCCSCCRSCPNWEKILPRNNWFRCSPGLKAFPSIANSNNFNRFELLMGALFFIPHGGLWSAYVFFTPSLGHFHVQHPVHIGLDDQKLPHFIPGAAVFWVQLFLLA